MKRAAVTIFMVLALTATARADGAEDGNRGLQALDQGDYDAAIAAFTHAIKYGGLSADDKEFAYANRGKAHLKKGEYSAAIADLDYARQAKPDDAEAQGDLLVALRNALPASSIPDGPKQNYRPKLNIWNAITEGFNQGMERSRQQILQLQQMQQQQERQ